MPVKFTLHPISFVMPSRAGTIVEPMLPDPTFNERGFTCPACFKDIGLTIRSGIRDGLVVKCPQCSYYSRFERREF